MGFHISPLLLRRSAWQVLHNVYISRLDSGESQSIIRFIFEMFRNGVIA